MGSRAQNDREIELALVALDVADGGFLTADGRASAQSYPGKQGPSPAERRDAVRAAMVAKAAAREAADLAMLGGVDAADAGRVADTAVLAAAIATKRATGAAGVHTKTVITAATVCNLTRVAMTRVQRVTAATVLRLHGLVHTALLSTLTTTARAVA